MLTGELAKKDVRRNSAMISLNHKNDKDQYGDDLDGKQKRSKLSQILGSEIQIGNNCLRGLRG